MKKYIFWFLLLFPLIVSAGGFQLNSLSPGTAAMGGGVTGFALDASAAYFNPAALAKLQGNTLTAGVALQVPLTVFSSPYGKIEEMGSSAFASPFLYGSYRLSKKTVIGLSVNSPYGYNSNWKDDWSGRYVSISSRLNSTYIQPSLSYQLGKNIFIGAGPVLAFSSIKAMRLLDLSSSSIGDARLQTEGGAAGFGFNAGLLASFGKTMLGINYRSAVNFLEEDGEAAFMNIPSLLVQDGIFPTVTTFKSEWSLPSVLSVGLSRSVDEKVTLALDFSTTGWSVYDSVNIGFSDYPQLNQNKPRKYTNSFSLRGGVQYVYSPKITFRGGLAYETSPVPDGYVIPETADAGRFLFAGGGTLMLKKSWSIDVALMIENMQERLETDNVVEDFNGNYKTIIYGAVLGIQKVF